MVPTAVAEPPLIGEPIATSNRQSRSEMKRPGSHWLPVVLFQCSFGMRSRRRLHCVWASGQPAANVVPTVPSSLPELVE